MVAAANQEQPFLATSIEEIMIKNVMKVNESMSVKEACRLMKEKNIGSLICVDDQDSPKGIFTERDLLFKVIAEDKSLDTSLKEHMTDDFTAVPLEGDIYAASLTMLNKRYRHLPVLKDGKCVGIISQGDVMKFMREVIDKTSYYRSFFTDGEDTL